MSDDQRRDAGHIVASQAIAIIGGRQGIITHVTLIIITILIREHIVNTFGYHIDGQPRLNIGYIRHY